MGFSIECIIAGGLRPEPFLPKIALERLADLEAQELAGSVEPGTAHEARANELPGFLLRVPSLHEQAEIDGAKAPEFNKTTGTIREPRIGHADLKLLQCGIVGWQNFKIGDELQKFTGVRGDDGIIVGATLDDIGKIPGMWREEIARELDRMRWVGKPDFR